MADNGGEGERTVNPKDSEEMAAEEIARGVVKIREKNRIINKSERYTRFLLVPLGSSQSKQSEHVWPNSSALLANCNRCLE